MGKLILKKDFGDFMESLGAAVLWMGNYFEVANGRGKIYLIFSGKDDFGKMMLFISIIGDGDLDFLAANTRHRCQYRQIFRAKFKESGLDCRKGFVSDSVVEGLRDGTLIKRFENQELHRNGKRFGRRRRKFSKSSQKVHATSKTQ